MIVIIGGDHENRSGSFGLSLSAYRETIGALVKPCTSPRIFAAQNTEESRRLVAAQARMYSEAKRIFFGRVAAVGLLAVAAMATATIWPESRLVVGGGGGILLFALSFVAESIEKRRRINAAATQEMFDTRIYQIPWNPLHATRPPLATIAQASSKYSGGRDANWYDDTEETERPFDVLICQGTNLGWGASMHRLWGWILAIAGVALVGILAAAWLLLGLPPGDALVALVIPSFAPFREIGTLVRSNFESAATKEATERAITEMWEEGMKDATITPSEQSVRSIQDKIIVLRQSNPYVPDWLDSIFHQRNEAAMRTSVQDKVMQAKRCGRG